MKKILVILLLMINLSIFGATRLKLTEINIKPRNCDWTGWLICIPEPIDVEFSPETKSIIIFSDVIQKYTYNELTEVTLTNCVAYTGKTVDKNKKNGEIVVYFYKNDNILLHIIYLDGEFIYKLRK